MKEVVLDFSCCPVVSSQNVESGFQRRFADMNADILSQIALFFVPAIRPLKPDAFFLDSTLSLVRDCDRNFLNLFQVCSHWRHSLLPAGHLLQQNHHYIVSSGFQKAYTAAECTFGEGEALVATGCCSWLEYFSDHMQTMGKILCFCPCFTWKSVHCCCYSLDCSQSVVDSPVSKLCY